MAAQTSIPMLHGTAIGMVMNLLDEAGVPLAAGLRAARLPSRLLDDSTIYVPFKAACDWVYREQQTLGIANLTLRAAAQAGSGNLPAGIRAQLVRQPTLYRALHAWRDLIRRESSHVSINIEEDVDCCRLLFSSTFDQQLPGQAEWIWFAIVLHTSVVQLFLGKDWQPDEITIPVYGPDRSTGEALWTQSDFKRNSQITGISIPRALLGRAPISTTTRNADPFPEPPDDLISSLDTLIISYLGDGAPSLDLAAEFAGESKRTLQRRLAASQLTYAEIVQKIRFREARQYLLQPDIPIGEIARRLGYQHVPHFSRAFRRMAGISPSDYRTTLHA